MIRRVLTLLPLAILSACASQQGFPSLAERPIERELSGRPTPPCAVTADAPTSLPPRAAPAPVADDAALPARLAALTERARSGQTAFTAALAPAEAAVARAGASGSETWVAAQTALSRLEAARAPTVDALAELDALLLERSGKASASDLSAIAAATAAAQADADTQAASLAALGGRLGS